MHRSTALHVNGTKVQVDVDPERTLLSVLRDDLELTGAKYGCGEGRCGACTVLVDGEAVRSCKARVGAVGSKEVITVESLERDGKLHPLQQAFLEAGALQCGYCTCGMIMSAAALLQRNPDPSTSQILEAMDGNVCRCGCYARVVSAILLAAKALKEETR